VLQALTEEGLGLRAAQRLDRHPAAVLLLLLLWW
jgi:hypothetical protein